MMREERRMDVSGTELWLEEMLRDKMVSGP